MCVCVCMYIYYIYVWFYVCTLYDRQGIQRYSGVMASVPIKMLIVSLPEITTITLDYIGSLLYSGDLSFCNRLYIHFYLWHHNNYYLVDVVTYNLLLLCLITGVECKGGATNLKEGEGGQCIGRCGVNTVKTLKFAKGGGAWPPPSSYGGAAPGWV